MLRNLSTIIRSAANIRAYYSFSIILAVTIVGCASLPPPPEGETCILSISKPIENSRAICVPIQATIAREYLSVVDGTHAIPISEMQHYVTFSPQTWSNIEAYILKLKALVKEK